MMKRAVPLAVLTMLLLFAPPVGAQYGSYYYHRVGDTIEWKPNNGYFSWWEFEYYHENNLKISIDKNYLGTPTGHDSCRILQYFYTPTPLKIIGVAGSSIKYRADTYVPIPNFLSASVTGGEPEYYLIYDADSTDFVLKARVEWNSCDPHRMVHLWTHKGVQFWGSGSSMDDSCCNTNTEEIYLPIFEYYFDEPIYVTDSFYVGTTTRNLARASSDIYAMPMVPVTRGYSDCNNDNIAFYINACYPVNLTQKGIGSTWRPNTMTAYPTDQWWWAHSSVDHDLCPLLIYPIIQVDTTLPPPDLCDSLRNVQVTNTDSTAIVTWDNFPNYSSVYLKYGYGSPNLWQTVDVTGNTSYTITNLVPGQRYGVTMKAVCEISKKETPWTEPVHFYTVPGTTAIEEGPQNPASPLAAQTFLQPNPAHGNTTVSSFFNLRRIEIVDIHGVMVYSEPVHGHRVTIPLDGLRSGTYIVAIHTHDGTTHKKLIVQ
ncbi:MAG: T9SS type A sorting domain-containing protein [Bacteroidales bacterium]|nr:T9SS type A sorting domain-containing protein [Bacteroidales bacterium]